MIDCDGKERVRYFKRKKFRFKCQFNLTKIKGPPVPIFACFAIHNPRKIQLESKLQYQLDPKFKAKYTASKFIRSNVSFGAL